MQVIFSRCIHTDDGINGVANYINNHGYTNKLRRNGAIRGFSSGYFKKNVDNSI